MFNYIGISYCGFDKYYSLLKSGLINYHFLELASETNYNNVNFDRELTFFNITNIESDIHNRLLYNSQHY